VARNQPAAMAAMEGSSRRERRGHRAHGPAQRETGQIDNPIVVNDVLSFLIYGTTKAEVKGLDRFPRDQWPTALPLLFYAYHIMAGLGTWFVLLMAIAAFCCGAALYTARWVLWALLLSFPLPYIANTAGWMTAELGRQPWLIYGLMRTSEGYSNTVSASNGLFTLLGFMGCTRCSACCSPSHLSRDQHGPEPKGARGEPLQPIEQRNPAN
jgi:cytochrome bd ubiquinol oxidase subunit I